MILFINVAILLRIPTMSHVPPKSKSRPCRHRDVHGKHLRARERQRAGSNLSSLLLDIEQPLQDATHTVDALRLVGHGLVLHDNAGGDAVAELARIAAERLQVVEDTWTKGLEAGRRGRIVGLSGAG